MREGTKKSLSSGEEEEMAERFDSKSSVSSANNEDDSSWSEKKRNYCKKTKDHKGCKRSLEKDKDLSPLSPQKAYLCIDPVAQY